MRAQYMAKGHESTVHGTDYLQTIRCMVRHWTGSYKHSPWHRPHGTCLHLCLGQDPKDTVQQQLQQRGYITKIQASGQALVRLIKAQSMALTICKVSDIWSDFGQAHKTTVHGIDHEFYH